MDFDYTRADFKLGINTKFVKNKRCCYCGEKDGLIATTCPNYCQVRIEGVITEFIPIFVCIHDCKRMH
jgi:hypothetical protein